MMQDTTFMQLMQVMRDEFLSLLSVECLLVELIFLAYL